MLSPPNLTDRALASRHFAQCDSRPLLLVNLVAGPHDTGSYNSSPEETGFFCSWGGNWETDYGR